MTKTCPTCKGKGSVPILPDDVKFRIARVAEREISGIFPKVFCGRCGGRHFASNSCPYCELQERENWDEGDFFAHMMEHRKRMPEVYDDANWYAREAAHSRKMTDSTRKKRTRSLP